MKRVLVKSLLGDLLEKHESVDPNSWIFEGIKSGRWGNSERQKKLKDCSKLELSNVVKIVPPDDVVVGADYKFEVTDIQSELLDKQKNKQKRKDLVRDWDALHPRRKAILIKRIMCFVLENTEIEVSDV